MSNENNVDNSTVVSESKSNNEIKFETTYLKAEDKIRINSLLERLESSIREEDKPILEEIKKLVFTVQNYAKPKTYIITGNIVEKLKQQIKKTEVTFPSGKTYKVSEERQASYFYRIKVDVKNNQFHLVWCFSDHLDEPTDWLKVEAIEVGDKYELEVDKNKSSNFKLRSLNKII